jgi:rod shape-determining protein MreB
MLRSSTGGARQEDENHSLSSRWQFSVAPLLKPSSRETRPPRCWTGCTPSSLAIWPSIWGPANTLIYIRGQGIVSNEPSVVAVQQDGRGAKRVMAVGKEAKEMLGRRPGTSSPIRPMKDGVIADFEITAAMLRYFIQTAHNRKIGVKPRIIIGIPSGITEVERAAVREAAENAGAREVYLIEQPMAAAIGPGLPVTEPEREHDRRHRRRTSDVAVISLSGIVFAKSVRVGGDKLDESIIQYVKRKYNLLIGERTAELIKMGIGTAYPTGRGDDHGDQGRDLVAGVPRTLTVTSDEVREALAEPVNGSSRR